MASWLVLDVEGVTQRAVEFGVAVQIEMTDGVVVERRVVES